MQPLKAAADRSRPPALPDENPNTPLAPVVPAFTDRSTALPLLVAVPSPKPNDKAPTVFTVLPPAMASILLPAPLVLLPTVGEINPPRPSLAAPVPSRRCCRSTRCPTRTPTHYGRRGSYHRRTTANYDPEAAGRPFIIIRHIRHEHSEHRALLWLPLNAVGPRLSATGGVRL